MRLVACNFHRLLQHLEQAAPYSVLGCFSFEPRCITALQRLVKVSSAAPVVRMVEVASPDDAFPDYGSVIRKRISENRARLAAGGLGFTTAPAPLLSSEDTLLDIIDSFIAESGSTVVMDITCFPKRFLCFFLKRLMRAPAISNLCVTYTEVGSGGYVSGHLSEDPMSGDYLPGFAGSFPSKGGTVVISAGFESYGITSLLESFRDGTKAMKIILAFPPDGAATRRQWNTIRQLAVGRSQQIRRENIEVIAAWDAEQVYRTLRAWEDDESGLTLAPFGPKPHTMGMALFAMEYDAPLYYTQPKSYNPDYSKSSGATWAYILKWQNAQCIG